MASVQNWIVKSVSRSPHMLMVHRLRLPRCVMTLPLQSVVCCLSIVLAMFKRCHKKGVFPPSNAKANQEKNLRNFKNMIRKLCFGNYNSTCYMEAIKPTT